MGIQVREDSVGIEQVEDYSLRFYGKGNEDHQLGQDFLYIRYPTQQLGERSLLVVYHI